MAHDFESYEDRVERRRFDRKVNRGGRRYACPDCGAKNALTAWEVNRGYHCARCTAIAEGSLAYE